MVNWFVKAYEFNCCVNDHEKAGILKILVDINNNCNKMLTEMLKSVFGEDFKNLQNEKN